MPMPSFSVICSIVFICFIFHSIYSISLLFSSPPCRDDEPCLSSFLSGRPKMDLHLFMSIMAKPTYQRDTEHVHSLTPFDYQQTQEMFVYFLQLFFFLIFQRFLSNFFVFFRPVIIDVPRKTSQNGTLYLHLIITPESNKYRRVFNDILQVNNIVYLKNNFNHFIDIVVWFCRMNELFTWGWRCLVTRSHRQRLSIFWARKRQRVKE